MNDLRVFYDGTVLEVNDDKVTVQFDTDQIAVAPTRGLSYVEFINKPNGIFFSKVYTESLIDPEAHPRHSGTIIKRLSKYYVEVEDHDAGDTIRIMLCLSHNVGDEVEMAIYNDLIYAHNLR